MKKIRIIGKAFLSGMVIWTMYSCTSNDGAPLKNNTNTVENDNAGPKSPPNIVYIMSDDHAYQAISAYGSEISKLAPTPNIDRIASEGAIINNAYCTNSICGPSRSAILTGKFSHINGFFKNVNGGDFDGSQQTFPKLFQAAGYETAVIGKWHLGTEPTGFDYSKVLINWGGQGTYFNPVFAVNGKDTITETRAHSTQIIEDDCIDWLSSKRDTNKPFMLLYQFKAPHRPWKPDPRYKDLFSDFDFPLPDNFYDSYEGRKAASEQWMEIANHMNRRDHKQQVPENLHGADSMQWLNYGNEGQFWTPDPELKGKALAEWKYQNYIKDYLRCVAGVDRAVGRLLDYLKENGLDKNTIVMYSADQGFYLGEHGWFDKRWMYEESFKMPLLVKYPGVIEPGTEVNDMVMNIDYAPTMLDLAGLNIPQDMQGQTFAPALKKEGTNGRKAVYYHYYEWPKWHMVQPHYGVRTDRYKLMHFYYSMDEWELYDMKEDPSEMNNLYGKEGYEEITTELKSKLKELQAEYNDNMTLDQMRALTDTVIERVYHEPN